MPGIGIICKGHEKSKTRTIILCVDMAPYLTPWQHEIIRGMIQDGKSTPEIVGAVDCSEKSVFKIRSNLQRYGSTRALASGGGRPPSIPPTISKALCDQLVDRPELYVEEMAVFLYDEFGIMVSKSSLQRALSKAGWSRKVSRQVAKERNADLRDYYLHGLSVIHK